MADNKTPQPNIEQIRDLLSPYLDGEVTEAERRLVETTLDKSPELQWELETLRQTTLHLAALPPMPAPRPFTLSEADVKPVKPTSRRWFQLPMWMGGLAAAAVAFLCVVTAGLLFLFNSSFNTASAPVGDIAAVQEFEATAAEEAAPVQEEAAVESAAAPEEASDDAAAPSQPETSAKVAPAEKAAPAEAPPAEEGALAQEEAAANAETTTLEFSAESEEDTLAQEAAPAQGGAIAGEPAATAAEALEEEAMAEAASPVEETAEGAETVEQSVVATEPAVQLEEAPVPAEMADGETMSAAESGVEAEEEVLVETAPVPGEERDTNEQAVAQDEGVSDTDQTASAAIAEESTEVEALEAEGDIATDEADDATLQIQATAPLENQALPETIETEQAEATLIQPTASPSPPLTASPLPTPQLIPTQPPTAVESETTQQDEALAVPPIEPQPDQRAVENTPVPLPTSSATPSTQPTVTALAQATGLAPATPTTEATSAVLATAPPTEVTPPPSNSAPLIIAGLAIIVAVVGLLFISLIVWLASRRRS